MRPQKPCGSSGRPLCSQCTQYRAQALTEESLSQAFENNYTNLNKLPDHLSSAQRAHEFDRLKAESTIDELGTFLDSVHHKLDADSSSLRDMRNELEQLAAAEHNIAVVLHQDQLEYQQLGVDLAGAYCSPASGQRRQLKEDVVTKQLQLGQAGAKFNESHLAMEHAMQQQSLGLSALQAQAYNLRFDSVCDKIKGVTKRLRDHWKECQEHAVDARRSFGVSADQRKPNEVARDHILPTASMCGKRKWAHLPGDDGWGVATEGSKRKPSSDCWAHINAYHAHCNMKSKDHNRPVVNKRKKQSSAPPRAKSQRSKGNKQSKQCLSCMPPEEAARMLEEQASEIQYLQNNLAAVKERIAEFEAAIVDDEEQHEAEMQELQAELDRLEAAKAPWDAQLEPVRLAIRQNQAAIQQKQKYLREMKEEMLSLTGIRGAFRVATDVLRKSSETQKAACSVLQRRLESLTAQAAAAKQAAEACMLCSEAAMWEVAAEINQSLMQDFADCDLRRQQAQQAQQQGRRHERRHAMDLLAMAAASIGGSSLSPEAEHLWDTAVQIRAAILHQLNDTRSAAEAVQSTQGAGAQQQADSSSFAEDSAQGASAGLQSSAEASVQHNTCVSSRAQQHAGSGVRQAAPADMRRTDSAKAETKTQLGAATSQQVQSSAEQEVGADGGEPKTECGEPQAGVGELRVGCGELKADFGELKADVGGHRGNGGELKADVRGHRGNGGEAIGGQQQRRKRTAYLRDDERQSAGEKRQSVGGKRTREISEEDLVESPEAKPEGPKRQCLQEPTTQPSASGAALVSSSSSMQDADMKPAPAVRTPSPRVTRSSRRKQGNLGPEAEAGYPPPQGPQQLH